MDAVRWWPCWHQNQRERLTHESGHRFAQVKLNGRQMTPVTLAVTQCVKQAARCLRRTESHWVAQKLASQLIKVYDARAAGIATEKNPEAPANVALKMVPDQQLQQPIGVLGQHTIFTRPRCPSCGGYSIGWPEHPIDAMRVMCQAGHWWVTERYIDHGDWF